MQNDIQVQFISMHREDFSNCFWRLSSMPARGHELPNDNVLPITDFFQSLSTGASDAKQSVRLSKCHTTAEFCGAAQH
jgi:hypothetical protein